MKTILIKPVCLHDFSQKSRNYYREVFKSSFGDIQMTILKFQSRSFTRTNRKGKKQFSLDEVTLRFSLLTR